MLDKLTYAGREENLHDLAARTRAFASCTARSRIRRRSRDGDRAAARRRSSTSPPRPMSTARSPSPTRSCAPTRSAPTCCSRRRASTTCATCRSPPTRCMARSSEGTFTEPRPLRPPRPTRATKAGADLLVQSYFHTYGLPAAICRGSNNYGPYQYPEKLIPLMILNALARRRAARLRRRHAGAQLDPRERLRDARSAMCSSTARRPRSTTPAGPTRRRTSTSCGASSRSSGASESQIEHVTDRPGHDRRYSLSSEKVRALGWGPRVRFAEGLERDGRLVSRQRVVVAADPLGRLPRLLRAPVRTRAGLRAQVATPAARGSADRTLAGKPASPSSCRRPRSGRGATPPATQRRRRSRERSARRA